ncbi:hypothetical protein E1286_05045 [Nonomuraea terrae]|uniref:SWIM-type domain-containing protein n=1 Tax=Nonomuraea terrae TaxID=2530383 RepID=A0A4R4ZA02_9ACTN|nr:hypothetical protein [Nonomuraea terrae]TDD54560.1 hypothetical protein E1286_05045 [Nonomuraea terrae]
MAVDVRSLACSYVRNGNVAVVSATPADDADRQAGHVIAYVHGQSRTYQVTLGRRGWSCTCEEANSCPHAAAVQLVTGHDGLARKSGESG